MTTMSDRPIPLCVDLDGTLSKTDSLLEGLLFLIKHNIGAAIKVPFWMLKGRAFLKARVAEHAPLDTTNLPFDAEVLARIQTARHAGQKTVLCTGADRRYAEAVEARLQLFDRLMSSDGIRNLTGSNKTRALVTEFGEKAYDFIGDSHADFGALKNARTAMLVRASGRLRRKLRNHPGLEILVPRQRVQPTSVLRQIRIHQWIKNVLIFLPLVAAQRFDDISSVVACITGFLSFSLCASSIYVLNDLMDVRADRRHPTKQFRPIAAAEIPIRWAIAMIPALLLLGLVSAIGLPIEFIGVLVGYLFVAFVYNIWAKNVAVLDTLFLAGMYTIRILAGAAAISVIPSFWLLALSMFLFLSIAIAKRYTELLQLALDDGEVIPGRQYGNVDLGTLVAQGTASGYAAVLVLALYINSDEIAANYAHPMVIWLACPVLLYWVSKLWLNAARNELPDDPLMWAMTNRVSRGLAIVFLLLLLVAM